MAVSFLWEKKHPSLVLSAGRKGVADLRALRRAIVVIAKQLTLPACFQPKLKTAQG
jgi:hypothetical protein